MKDETERDEKLGARHRLCECDELAGIASVRHWKVRHQQVVGFFIGHRQPNRCAAHVAHEVRPP